METKTAEESKEGAIIAKTIIIFVVVAFIGFLILITQ